MNKVYQIITERILGKMREGIIPWRQTWKSRKPINHITKRPYHGINVLLLGTQPYSCNQWLTFNQCQQSGGQIKKGEHASLVVFWKVYEKETGKMTKDEESGELKPEMKKWRVLRYYKVWNVEQTTLPIPQTPTRSTNKIRTAEKLVNSYKGKPEVKASKQPCYNAELDLISIPRIVNFENDEAYYATLFHELTHSTGHKKRLNRFSPNNFQFASRAYSKEELIAELGACFLCNEAGIENKIEQNAIAYLQNWIQALQNNSKLVVESASKADRAVNFMMRSSKDFTEFQKSL